jgi:hypothetical protein
MCRKKACCQECFRLCISVRCSRLEFQRLKCLRSPLGIGEAAGLLLTTDGDYILPPRAPPARPRCRRCCCHRPACCRRCPSACQRRRRRGAWSTPRAAAPAPGAPRPVAEGTRWKAAASCVERFWYQQTTVPACADNPLGHRRLSFQKATGPRPFLWDSHLGPVLRDGGPEEGQPLLAEARRHPRRGVARRRRRAPQQHRGAAHLSRGQ